MAKPANRERGEVALNEAGDGVVLRFSNDAMERLFSEFGEEYIDDLIKKLNLANPSAFKTALEAMVETPEGVEVNYDERPWGLSWDELHRRILDAMFLALHKRTYEEHQKFLEEELGKQLEEVKENPNPVKAAKLYEKLSKK